MAVCVHVSAPLCGRKLELWKAIGTVYEGGGHGGVGDSVGSVLIISSVGTGELASGEEP